MILTSLMMVQKFYLKSNILLKVKMLILLYYIFFTKMSVKCHLKLSTIAIEMPKIFLTLHI